MPKAGEKNAGYRGGIHDVVSGPLVAVVLKPAGRSCTEGGLPRRSIALPIADHQIRRGRRLRPTKHRIAQINLLNPLCPRGESGIWEGLGDGLILNVRYAVRRLFRSPMFTLVAVLSLGLGIGANTAMFSLVNAVIIRDMPYENPETLVDVYERQEGFSAGTLSYPDYVDLLDGSEGVFDDIAGSQVALLQADAEGGVEMLPGEAVTGNYFPLLGVQPAVGRLISNEDHVARGAHPVVVLGYGYWQRRFAGDPAAVGAELRLAGRAYTIICVVSKEYTGNRRGFVPDA